MKVHKAFCLFEQSGTWKNEFRKLGIDAEDYDILDDFGETDHVIDLFGEIEKAYSGAPSLFDEIGPDDLTVAFFPCTRFEAVIPLAFRGEQLQQKAWTDARKLEYSMQLHGELHDLYMLICKLFAIANRGGVAPHCRKSGEDCPDRREGCHSTCAAYLEYRRYMDGRKRERAKDALVKNARYDMARRARKKTTHGEKK